MMFNLRKRKSGFSLIELLVAITIMLLLVGIAAWFLDDYLYKAKVAKAQQDLDMFAGALRLYDSLENSPFSSYNYSTAVAGAGGTQKFSFFPIAIASYWAAFGTVGGAATQWSDYSSNSLVGLIGSYLKTVPPDPWGSAYLLNTSSGALSSMGADLVTCVGGNSFGITETGRSRDIVNYYLGDKLVLSAVSIWDNNNNGTVDAVEYIDFTFNKDVQAVNQNMSTTNCFEISTDGGLTWGPLTAGVTPYFINAGQIQSISPVRLQNDARTLRYVFYQGVTMNTLLGKLIRVKISNPVDGTSSFIMDTDQYSKQPATTFSKGGFGRNFISSNNVPVEIKVRTF